MSDKVIPLGNITKLDLPPDRILESTKGKMQSVLLMGWDKNGDLYFASSIADGGEILWLMEHAKIQLLTQEG